MNYQLLGPLRVIESSAFIAAPLAGLTLAQFGADVIRVDLIGGGIDYGRLPLAPGGRSLYWTGLNKAKRSIAIDIRKPQGRELLRTLVAAPGPDGGVLLTNIATPWLSHSTLASLRADVITCTISGNPDGSTAVDYMVNAATGFPAITGNGSIQAPVNHVLPAWDVACAYQAAFALLAAGCCSGARPVRAPRSAWRCRTWPLRHCPTWACWRRPNCPGRTGRIWATISMAPLGLMMVAKH